MIVEFYPVETFLENPMSIVCLELDFRFHKGSVETQHACKGFLGVEMWRCCGGGAGRRRLALFVQNESNVVCKQLSSTPTWFYKVQSASSAKRRGPAARGPDTRRRWDWNAGAEVYNVESVLEKKVCFRFYRQAQSSHLLYEKFFFDCFFLPGSFL